MGDSALSLLKEEFKDSDIRSRKRAVERLHVVAKSLGPERTRKELLPWIVGVTKNNAEEDEVLYILGDQVTRMVDLVGGAKYAPVLLDPLEVLCNVEETLVRDRAIEGIVKLSAVMKKDAVDSAVIPIIQRLSKGDWFTTKMSACGLMSEAMKRCSGSEPRSQLMDLYAKLCSDDTPMVRRSAAKVIHKVVKYGDNTKVTNDLLPVLKALSRDTQDVVRLNTINNLGDIAKQLSDSDFNEHLLSTVVSLATDRSWRVRHSILKSLDIFADKVGKEKAKSVFVPILVELLKDPEIDVRRQSVKRVPHFTEILGADALTDHFMPVIQEQAGKDDNPKVRLAMAECFVHLLSKVPSSVSKQHLKPLIFNFFKDHRVMDPDVTLALLNGLGRMASVFGGEQVVGQKGDGWGKLILGLYNGSKAKPPQENMTMQQMEDVEYPQWRFRKAIVGNLDKIMKNSTKEVETFVTNIWTMALTDEVRTVRQSAADALHDFCSSSANFGRERAAKVCVPILNEMYSNSKSGNGVGIGNNRPNYVLRIVFLSCFKAVKKYQDVWKLLAPNVEDALNDNVTNVKVSALKMLAESAHDIGKASGERFRPILQQLSKSKDEDVSYWAGQALMDDVL